MKGEGCGNAGPWTPRKTKSRFPSAPTVLGNRKRRDSHIPTAPKRGTVENEKHVSHCSAGCFYTLQTESERRPGGGSLRSRLQAHSSMRKCCTAEHSDGSEGAEAESATGFKKEIRLAGPLIHTPFTGDGGGERNWLGKGINHGPEPCTHAPRTSGTRCAARPKQSLNLQSNFRMAADPPAMGPEPPES